MVCFDAKINFDDNAEFRQKDVFEMDDMAESDPREVEASRHNLNYIGMDGNIGCLGEYFLWSTVYWGHVYFASIEKTYTG